jgi:branched-chain amino acid transport system permease protein
VAFTGIFGAYADALSNVFKFPDARFFLLASSDFSVFGISGIAIVSPATIIILTTSLYLFLTKTKFGVAMRATVENSSLAEVHGVDVRKVNSVSWFIAGGLAALAGNLFVLRLTGDPNLGADFTVAFFAACLLGGLSNVYGAVIGGILVGAGQILITSYISQAVGTWFLSYEPAVPMVIMIVGLLVVPEGLTSIKWRPRRRQE